MDIGIPEGDYETVAGFLMTRLGVVPRGGEHIQHGDYVLEVTKVQGIRIEEVMIRRLPEAAGESPPEAGVV